MRNLTKAVGINRPSLYAAFGSKEGLFRQALDRYAEGPAAEPVRRELASRHEREAGPKRPRDCARQGC